ncbi:acid phosphatase [Labrys wisconsinensis]|uniref:glycerophosphodiester phosphodiesterase n=1 Tax=Labrys wisconsinensis TaxID=425677 RepID=A0ABU0J1Q3_9HYPH|nr:acid phosphatase [Labrys wisconsinensis]MDQ0468169.1 acid phosphatase [Labrys wisconsinensis]
MAEDNPFARINHIVVIYTENRSFDNLFSEFPGADGLRPGMPVALQVDTDGSALRTLPPALLAKGKVDGRLPGELANAPFLMDDYLPQGEKTGDLVHKFYQEQEQIDGGKNDRFAAVSDAGGLTMGYYDGSDQKLWAMAKAYTLADHFHHAAFGGSFLNHFWLVCACTPVFPNAPASMVAAVDPATGWLARAPDSPRSAMDGPPKWVRDGAVSPDGYGINTLQPSSPPYSAESKPEERLPLQTLPTIGDRLSEKGISWAWYSGGWADAVSGKIKVYAAPEYFQSHHQPFNYFAAYAPGKPAREEHLKDLADFKAAISSGSLPAVSFYKPVGRDNLHPGYADLTTGEAHVAEIVAALEAGPNWKDTLLVITPDENGGTWDHVAPPKVDRWGPGTRVPTLILSPFARKGFVDHTVYDTTAILKTIEVRYGLAPLATRDAASPDLRNALVDESRHASAEPKPFLTLDGKPPLVVGHRGLPGLMPEETLPSYDMAAELGTDALEEDLHLTKDCVLVARHNPWLSDNTNVSEVAKTNPDVAARKRTVPGVKVKVAWPATPDSGPSDYLTDRTDPADPKSVLKSLIVDGEDHTNDWSITDFTLAELKAWFAGTTYDAASERPKEFNGKFPILSFQEIVDIAKAKSQATGRPIAVYPESKNPTWNDEQAIANGCGAPGSHPLEDAFIKIIEQNGLNSPDAPIFVQSFEPSSLKYMRTHGLKTKIVQLIDGYDVDFKTGHVIYNEIVDSRPYDWTVAGDPRWFDAMLTPAGLAEIKTYADGIGPWKPQIVPVEISPWTDKNADGTPFTGSTRQARTQPPTSVIADAHKAGLFVHVFTFRNEKKYLAGDYNGDPQQEYLKFFRLGVDGVFTDFTNTAVIARMAYLRELGR